MNKKSVSFFVALAIGICIGLFLFLFTKKVLFFILGSAFGFVALLLFSKNNKKE